MPFVPNTPESLSVILSRADSKSPSSTCCGVTNSGKPCNRELKSTPGSNSPSSGIIAIIAGSRVFFCDSHKDQAQNVVLRHTASFARRRELVGRGSMDTFIEQVEVLVGGPGGSTKTKVTAKTKRVKGKDDPFAPVEEKYPNTFTAQAGPPSPPTGYQRKQQRRKKPSLLRRLLCCCTTGEDEEYNMNAGRKQTEAELRAAAAAVVENSVARPARVHGKDKRESKVLFETTPPTPPLPMMYPGRKNATGAITKNGKSAAGGLTVGHGRTPASQSDDDSDTGIFSSSSGSNIFYSYIPKTLSQKTQTRLQQELSKPFSDGDEPGYIYIFWLTDSPFSPASTPSGTNTHATNALLKTANAASHLPPGQKPRVLLKIGRANNVQRRLHEWSSQCGYNLSLVRFYPHVSASSTPVSTPGGKRSGGSTPSLHTQVGKKVPNSHRIEHLIHLELRDSLENPEIQCNACGKTHKEWFSVEASREGLQAVDEIVKKWTDYGERSAMVTGQNAQAAPMIPKTSATPSPAKAKTSTPHSNNTTPKKTKIKQDAAFTPTPVAKRPTLKDAPVAGAAKPAAKTGSSGKSTSSGRAGGSGRAGSSGKTGGSGKAGGSGKSQNLTPGSAGGRGKSPARSTKSGTSRPGSSNGKTKASPPRKKGGDKGGGWKAYDENEGADEYVPSD